MIAAVVCDPDHPTIVPYLFAAWRKGNDGNESQWPASPEEGSSRDAGDARRGRPPAPSIVTRHCLLQDRAGRGRKTFHMFLVAALLVGAGVAFGVWRHSLAEAEVNTTSQQRRNIVPAVRVTPTRANDGTMTARLPGLTEAFEAANIMARISGYVAKRYVDIGDHVRPGSFSPRFPPQELDHQIAQAQATLALNARRSIRPRPIAILPLAAISRLAWA